jgi:hypothetical protein
LERRTIGSYGKKGTREILKTYNVEEAPGSSAKAPDKFNRTNEKNELAALLKRGNCSVIKTTEQLKDGV